MSTLEREEYYSIGLRIKEEREKKGYSQDSLSKILHTSRKTVVNWEAGASAPDARQLAVMGSFCGFDTHYIVSGERMPLVACEDRAEYKSEMAQSLLEALSFADDDGKAALCAVARLVRSKEKQQ